MPRLIVCMGAKERERERERRKRNVLIVAYKLSVSLLSVDRRASDFFLL